MIRVHCPNCPKTYQVAEQKVGSRVQCKSCGAAFTVVMSAEETGVVHRPGQASRVAAGDSSTQIPAKLGQYILQKKLGTGAAGEVYLGHDPALDRHVAIKVLPPALARDEERLKRFTREAQLAARLHHTHAVSVYDFDMEGDHPYLAMEPVDGLSLDKIVADHGPLEWREATRVICDAARGLAAAHEIGLVHRDIKPANLIRTSKGVTKVIDFGLARATVTDVQLTQEGTLLGTPAYMAPEQWTSGEIDGRSDLYSLICSYYFLLTGQLAFAGESMPALGYQHRHEPFPDARQHRSDLPNGVCRVLARGSQKQPAERYQSAAELVGELGALLVSPEASLRAWDRVAEFPFSPAKVTATATEQPSRKMGKASAKPERAARPARLSPHNRRLAGAGAVAVLLVLSAFLGIIVLNSTPQALSPSDDNAVGIAAGGRPEQSVATVAPAPVPGSPMASTSPSPTTPARMPRPVSDTAEEAPVLDDLFGPPTATLFSDNDGVAGPAEPSSLVTAVSSAPGAGSPPMAVSPFDAAAAKDHQEAWATQVGQSVVLTNSIGMKLTLIPPGEFLMGSPEGEANREISETLHRVRITQPFYLGVYEVTQGEYERVMGTNPSGFSGTGRLSDRVSGQDTSDFPVERVSWEDAVEFCRKLSTLSAEQSSGRVYRLPTEAEWEYA